jgi:biotin carboxyl carrier protein
MEDSMKKYNIRVNGKSYEVEVEEAGSSEHVSSQKSTSSKPTPPKSTSQSTFVPNPSNASGDVVTSPMPGTILDLKVSLGQTVKAGDILVILEAMKMENEIVAVKDGVVSKIYTSNGTPINIGEPIVSIE